MAKFLSINCVFYLEGEYMEGRDSKYCVAYCKCGCGNGVVLKVDDDGDSGISLQLVSDNFYSGRNNNRNTIKEKLKRIWYVISGKEYRYFDLYFDKNELEEFKDFVAKL